MVRINLINPKYLTDQHLIAEYAEILILIANSKKYPDCKNIPKEFCLGKGHQKFFRNKLKYLKNRHERIKKEMIKRGFKPRKTIQLKGVSKKQLKDFNPREKDKKIIRERILQRIRKKPKFYRYYREYKNKKFLEDLIKNAK